MHIECCARYPEACPRRAHSLLNHKLRQTGLKPLFICIPQGVERLREAQTGGRNLIYCLQMLVSPQEELQMPSSVGLSTCPKCQAIYHVLKVEGGPDAKATCRVCGAPLPTPQGLEDKFVLKYFLMREGSVTSLE